MNSKVLAFGMAAVSTVSAITPAISAPQISGKGESVPVELTVEKPTFSVTVPTGLPVAVDADGKIYCSTNATIRNNTHGQVKVSNVTIEGNNPWTVAAWDSDMQKEKVNTSKIAMQLNNGVTTLFGYDFQESNFPVMNGHSSMPITYDAKLPTQTKVINGNTVSNVVFTVGWNTGESDPVSYDIIPVQDVIKEDGIAHVNVDDSIDLTASAVYGTEETFWSCEQSDVLQITKNEEDQAIAKIVGPGSATVKYTNRGASGELKFESKAPLKSISMNHQALTMNKGTEADIYVTYNPSNTTDPKDVQWSSNHNDIVSVVDGHLVAKNWGEATITAKVGDHTAQCVVTVPQILSGVTLNEHNVTMENGTQHKLSVNTQYREVPVWSVIEGNCVTVNDGTITAKAPGTAKIQVQVGDFKDTCTVQVTQKLNSISLNQSSLKFNTIGATAQLNVNYNPSNTTESKNVQWSVAPAGVVSVSNGRVTTVGYGSATITARVGNKTATCSVLVDDGKPHSIDAPLDMAMMASQIGGLTGRITFSRDKAPTSGTVPVNGNGTVVAKISGQNATVYSRHGGGVAIPNAPSMLFIKEHASRENGFKQTPYAASSIDVSGMDTSKVTNMDEMFYGSKTPTIIGLKNFDTSNVTTMSEMFCRSGFTSLDLSGFNTSKVKDMGGMFCDSPARTLDLSHFDTRNVENMNGMFDSCKATSINVSNFNTSSLRYLQNMFACVNLSTLDLSSFNTSKVSNFMYIFYEANISKVYCRTAAEANSFRSAQCSNNSIPFIVGKP